MNKKLAAVVEDDVFLADIYSNAIQGTGLEVRVFHDGEDAMRNLRHLAPDLIILDLNLPKYSGIEIFRDLRKHAETANSWVLIVTANPAQAAELTQLEMDSQNLLVLAKPVSVEQLEQLAQRLVFRS